MIGPKFKAVSTGPVIWSPSGSSNQKTPEILLKQPSPPITEQAAVKSTPQQPPLPPPPTVQPSAKKETFEASTQVNNLNTKEKSETTKAIPPSEPKTPQAPPRVSSSLSDSEGSKLNSSARLPKPQNPTVTLLQRGREGRLPRGATYLQEQQEISRQYRDKSSPPRISGSSSSYDKEVETRRSTSSMGEYRTGGVGSTTTEGMPVTLRSEVKDPSKWYKQMYGTIHKNRNEASPAIHTTSPSRSQYAYFDSKSGYLSEPDGSSHSRRTRTLSNEEYRTSESSPYMPNDKYTTIASARARQEIYKNQPGRIENYVPGKSSVIHKESKQWWDEVMAIFDRESSKSMATSDLDVSRREHLTRSILEQSHMARAIKDGYDSDSTLVFRRNGTGNGRAAETEYQRSQRSAAYRALQAGKAQPPLSGFRSPAPSTPDVTEIEYIPINQTLTRIRIHKNITTELGKIPVKENRRQKKAPSFLSVDIPTKLNDCPTPPTRVSSKTNTILKHLVNPKTNPAKVNSKPKTNIQFLRNKITRKLTEKGLASKEMTKSITKIKTEEKTKRSFAMYKKKDNCGVGGKLKGTSSFASPGRTASPIIYKNLSSQPYDKKENRVVINGGVGRKTPITGILDNKTSIDRMWNEERNKVSKCFSKKSETISKMVVNPKYKKPTTIVHNSKMQDTLTKRGRSLTRTCDKISKSVLASNGKKDIIKTANIKILNYKAHEDSRNKNNTKQNNQNKKATMKSSNLKNPKLDTYCEIMDKRNEIITDSFFQNLFLRDLEGKISRVAYSSEKADSSFERPDKSIPEYDCNKAISLYLLSKKPVTYSKFIFMDRNNIINNRSISSPARITNATKVLAEENNKRSIDSLVPRSRSEPSNNKIFFSQTSRPLSPTVIFHKKSKIVDCSALPTAKMYFSETSRPVSPKIQKKTLYRKHCDKNTENNTEQDKTLEKVKECIESTKQSPSCRKIKSIRIQTTKQSNIMGELLRSQSADNKKYNQSNKTYESSRLRSQSNMQLKDFNEYISDVISKRDQSERFKELNRYYSYLERVAELEKATSYEKFRPRRPNEEIIDFDRWKKIRTIEKAETELNKLYTKLREAQDKSDIMFYPKDVKKLRWNINDDPVLIKKHKSVEDLKDVFQKPTQINTKNKSKFKGDKMWSSYTEGTNCNDLRKKIGLGQNLWSSLSTEQINKLKFQLNAIYGNEGEQNHSESKKVFEIDISKENMIQTPLKVRCNSFPTVVESEIQEENKFNSLKKPKSSVNKQVKVNFRSELTESDKKKISQTLSNELLSRIKQFSSSKIEGDKSDCVRVIPNSTVNETSISTEKNNNEEHLDKPRSSSASETETGSSEKSDATVIYKIPEIDVHKKVQYFENVKNQIKFTPVIYQPATEDSESTTSSDFELNKISQDEQQGYQTKNPHKQTENRYHSQSCTDLKELFGENQANNYMSLPIEKQHSPTVPVSSNSRFNYEQETSYQSSVETLYRSKSSTPDPEGYWRAFLDITRTGEVGRLRRRFESPVLKRHRSDPEVARDVLRREWPYIKYNTTRPAYDELAFHYATRERSRRRGAISPTSMKDRFMPHIDVISKTASLKQRRASMPTHSEPQECKTGEVKRLRQLFEVVGNSKQLTVSTPDVRYLSATWIAHRYPYRCDNNRSPVDGHLISSKVKPIRRPKSTPNTAKCGEFNPELHRPIARYTPQRSTVTFQEPERLSLHSSLSNGMGSNRSSESPRRYVESDVNIHYKVPVRSSQLPYVPDDELVRRQEEHMRHVYNEERKKKYLQELQDIQKRRHTDNFTPAQKAVVPLNRYDAATSSGEVRKLGRALYGFQSQVPRELTLRKDDIVTIRRQLDHNWYEGELRGKVGLFPCNYVEIISGGPPISPPTKPEEGRARCKFDFYAQTDSELSLKRGELVMLVRRVDENWWEGRIGNTVGIIPTNYIEVLEEPAVPGKKLPDMNRVTTKPVGSPAAHSLTNGSNTSDTLRSRTLNHYTVEDHLNGGGGTAVIIKPAINNHNRTNHTSINGSSVYRAIYKYKPQNPDELELFEGDTIYVMEKCDDGWYVGSSKMTGRFGTFPGNYVEKMNT